MMVSMATLAMLVVEMVVALRVTRATLVWMAPNLWVQGGFKVTSIGKHR